MLRTNVIHDCLAPRWMPWCTRAFALSVNHPASLLMLAVFDYDDVSPMDYHDPVGRIVVNITNFESDTVYLLHYKLHHDAREDDVSVNGIMSRICDHANVTCNLFIALLSSREEPSSFDCEFIGKTKFSLTSTL
jgi:hypothetical protein